MTTQPMPLEETVKLLREFTDYQETLQQFYTEPLPGIPVLRAALHHLEVGKRECQCEKWKQFGALLRPVKVAEHADGSSTWKNTCPTPTFCPWCGGSLTTPTTEPQG